MQIDVSVPGIRKERGKLPAPATLPTLRLTVPLATGPPICGALVGPTLCEPVTGGEVGASIASAHPVSAKTGKNTPIRSPSRSTGGRLHPVSGRSVLLRPSRMRGI
jgi:hypothetical protein